MKNKNGTAIILAAGIGSRLESMTKNKPKCLVKVRGKPILRYQIDSYLGAGIDKIIIVVGHMAEEISKFIEQTYKGNKKIQIIHNEIYKKSNNMYSLWLCKKYMESSNNTIVSNADVVFDSSIIKKLASKEGSYVVTDPKAFDEESMKITTVNGWIKSISKQIQKNKASGSSLDVYSFTKQTSLKLIREMEKIIEINENKTQWTEVALDNVLTKHDVIKPLAIDSEEKWYEIDNEKDLLNAEIIFSEIDTLLKNKKLFTFDLDGTIYLGENLIPGADRMVQKILNRGNEVKFLSNNSSRNKLYYSKKLSTMGIKVHTSQIHLSTDVAGRYLKKNNYQKGFIVGTEMMKRDLEVYGIHHTSENPEFVLLGYDTEINYDKIKAAANLINLNLPYFATHADLACPTPNGPVPDAGSFIELFAKSTARFPKVFGKPEVEMLNSIVTDDTELDECIFIGDRLYTDYLMAQKAKIDFICVLSGETQRRDLEELEHWPRLVIPSLNTINSFL